jgi:hypothetical protein
MVHQHVLDWLEGEEVYARTKWTDEMEDAIKDEDEYTDWVNSYIHRAKVLGLETPAGRQALAKALKTMQGFVESTVRKHGPLPDPGVPSGEIVTHYPATS